MTGLPLSVVLNDKKIIGQNIIITKKGIRTKEKDKKNPEWKDGADFSFAKVDHAYKVHDVYYFVYPGIIGKICVMMNASALNDEANAFLTEQMERINGGILSIQK